MLVHGAGAGAESGVSLTKHCANRVSVYKTGRRKNAIRNNGPMMVHGHFVTHTVNRYRPTVYKHSTKRIYRH